MNVPRIVSVKVVEDRRLLVEFADGTKKLYDCTPILRLERFSLLRNEAFFRAVRVDAGGYGISWNDDMDLSEYELWTNGVEVKEDNAPALTVASCQAVAQRS